MMQSEFEKMTGVKVSSDEYKAIETVYMSSDVDKVLFCQHWMDINVKRVSKAKEEREEAERKANLKMKLAEIDSWYIGPHDYSKVAYEFFNKEQKKVLKEAGLDVWFQTDYQGNVTIRLVSGVLYDLRKILKVVND